MGEFIPDKKFTADAPKKADATYPGSTLGLPQIPSALDVVLKPEGIPQHLISMGVTGGGIMKGGQLATQAATKLGLPELAQKAAPYLGRIGTAAGLGAAERLNRGGTMGEASRDAVIDAVLAGAVEGLTGVAGKASKATKQAVKDYGAATEAYQWALQAPQKAIDAIRHR